MTKTAEMYDFKLGEECWDTVRELLENTGHDVSESGLAVIRKEWEAGKGWLLPFFGETGRITGILDASRPSLQDISSLLENTCWPYICSKPGGHHQRVFDMLSFFSCYMVVPEEIAENKILRVKTVVNPTNPDKYLPKGCKASKYMLMWAKSMIDAVSEDDMHLLETAFSLLIKGVSEVGSYVLSINPVDYLMASVSPNYTSCYDITKRGDGGLYRSGTLSYMLDNKTILAYAYRNPCSISDMPDTWFPAKIWRAWVHLDKANPIALVGRQYPQRTVGVQNGIVAPISDLLSKLHKFDGKFHVFDKVSGAAHIPAGSAHTTKSCDYTNTPWSYHDSPTLYIKAESVTKPISLQVGVNEIPCIHCGDWRRDLRTVSFSCDACRDDVVHCSGCNCRLSMSEGHHYDGGYYCTTCYNDRFED